MGFAGEWIRRLGSMLQLEMRSSPPSSFIRLRWGRHDLELEVDFDTMKMRFGVACVAWNEARSIDGRSIDGFDVATFWTRMRDAGAFGWMTWAEWNADAWQQTGELKSQTILTVCHEGVLRKDIFLSPHPERIAAILAMLHPLTFESLEADLIESSFTCAYRDFESGNPRLLETEGVAAFVLGKQLAAIGFRTWKTDAGLDDRPDWQEESWDSVPDELAKGLPFILPARHQGQIRLEDRLSWPMSECLWEARWLVGETSQVIRGTDGRISLILLLSSLSYYESCRPPRYDACSDDADYVLHRWWNPPGLGKDFHVRLQVVSDEEVFKCELMPTPFLDGEPMPGSRTRQLARVRRSGQNRLTGVSWSDERYVSGYELDTMVSLLEMANASDWANDSGWPGNAWEFSAFIDGKAYACGGIAATGGSLGRPEPDPRLAVLRKILPSLA